MGGNFDALAVLDIMQTVYNDVVGYRFGDKRNNESKKIPGCSPDAPARALCAHVRAAHFISSHAK